MSRSTPSIRALLAITGLFACDIGPEPFPPAPAEPASLTSADFAGAEACASCHQARYDAWSSSTHGRAGGQPGDASVVAPFAGQPIHFSDAVVTPVRQANTWRFDVAWAEDTLSYEILGVIGRGHLTGGGTQGFVTEWPDGTVRFLPFDWSVGAQGWFCNTEGRSNTGWVLISETLSLTDCSDWPPRRILGSEARFQNCQGCHGSQLSVDFRADSGYHTEWSSLRIECEACHGPARDHVTWATTPSSGPDPMLRPLASLATEESLRVCESCHSLKSQLGSGFMAGSSNFENHFATTFAVLDQAPYAEDGRVNSFAYQGTHRSSACYLSGNMSCVSCHEPHGQGYWSVNRKRLENAFDDGQCTACHAAKARDPEAHTLHEPGSDGAQCVSCHMPYLQHPAVGSEVPFARADHTVSVPRPLFDASMGLEGACQRCHTDWSPTQLHASIEAGWGRVKPPRPLVDQQMKDRRALPANRTAAASAWLRPDLNDPVAQFTTLARFLVLFVEPDQSLGNEINGRLWELALSSHLDVQALAMASIHLSEGENPTTRRRLMSLLAERPGHDVALRRRWVAGLTFAGDQWRQAEDFAKAEAAYLRGLELLPEQTYLLQAVGILRGAGGEEFLRAAVAADPSGALSRVTLALFHQGEGDLVHAREALDSAVALNPWEPVSHFIYGRLLVQMGDLEGGIGLLERAVSLDGAYLEALSDLMLAYEGAGQMDQAAGTARRLLAFVPGHTEALRIAGR